jgi:hypothetical protein
VGAREQLPVGRDEVLQGFLSVDVVVSTLNGRLTIVAVCNYQGVQWEAPQTYRGMLKQYSYT